MKSLFLTTLLAFVFVAPVGAAPVDYHRDIAPLLRQYCAGCHNDDDFEGDFSVERYVDLEEGGSKGVMLRPGKPEGSYLMALMTGGDVSEPMPPRDEPQPTAEEIDLFARWIKEGAKGPEEDVSILTMLSVPDLPEAPGARSITAMARSTDGRWEATARFASVELRGGEHEKARTLGKLTGKVNALHFSADGGHLVAASGIAGLKGAATLWDVATGKMIREFGEGYHRDVLYDAELSPDGKQLATAGYDAKIALWDVGSGERLRTIEIHNGAIYDLAFSPDGKVLASASGDSTVKLWRVSDGERLDTLNQPQGEQYAVEFSPDGKFIFAAGADNRLRMWRFVSRDEPKINPLVHARFAHEDAVVGLALSADGKWLASSGDDLAIKLWALPDLTQVRAWEDQSDVAAALLFAGDRIVAGRMDGTREEGMIADPTLLGRGPHPVESGTSAVVNAAMGDPVKVTTDEKADSQTVPVPVEIGGKIESPGDADDFLFPAKAGETWILEVNAERMKSPLDSRVEVLTAAGEPIEQVRLQAVRDSWFEFRGKDSTQVGDFRVFNWREMELNEYLYCNGEVVKLWLYPRGPDSGFTVYPGMGKRHTWFNTSGLTHALGEPCQVVRPLPAGVEPVPNGLPVYTLYFENDDDPQRRFGADSVLTFTAPEDGKYRARISDTRGFGGEDFSYRLTVRSPKPDFKVKHNIDAKKGLTLAPGTGQEIVVTAERFDGFDGEIRVELAGLPEGWNSGGPIVIEAGQHQAMGTIHAAEGAPAELSLTATAMIGGKEVSHPLPDAGDLKLTEAPPKLGVEIFPDGESGRPVVKEGAPMELTIHPGETITAMVRADRVDFPGQIDFGKEDSGRNLAHGLIIDNIGLNGLMIPEGASEQRFFITAADWVPESTRTFHLRTPADGGRATKPIILHVKQREPTS